MTPERATDHRAGARKRSSTPWQLGCGQDDASEVVREALDAWLKTRRK